MVEVLNYDKMILSEDGFTVYFMNKQLISNNIEFIIPYYIQKIFYYIIEQNYLVKKYKNPSFNDKNLIDINRSMSMLKTALDKTEPKYNFDNILDEAYLQAYIQFCDKYHEILEDEKSKRPDKWTLDYLLSIFDSK